MARIGMRNLIRYQEGGILSKPTMLDSCWKWVKHFWQEQEPGSRPSQKQSLEVSDSRFFSQAEYLVSTQTLTTIAMIIHTHTYHLCSIMFMNIYMIIDIYIWIDHLLLALTFQFSYVALMASGFVFFCVCIRICWAFLPLLLFLAFAVSVMFSPLNNGSRNLYQLLDVEPEI